MDCHALLRGIFLRLLHWQADALPLSRPGSPFGPCSRRRLLEEIVWPPRRCPHPPALRQEPDWPSACPSDCQPEHTRLSLQDTGRQALRQPAAAAYSTSQNHAEKQYIRGITWKTCEIAPPLDFLTVPLSSNPDKRLGSVPGALELPGPIFTKSPTGLY